MRMGSRLSAAGGAGAADVVIAGDGFLGWGWASSLVRRTDTADAAIRARIPDARTIRLLGRGVFMGSLRNRGEIS
jgi:hypothetical protein